MTLWTDRLDKIKAGQAEKPTVVEILRLPAIVSWQTGQVVTKWEIDPDFFTTGDQVMGHTTMTVLDGDKLFRTIQMNVTFYRPMRKGVLWITGRVTQKTREAIHVNVEFCDVDGTLMCGAAGIQIVFPITPESSSVM